jgi:hypothetical protein
VLNNGGTKLMTEIKNKLKNNESNKHFINQNIVCRNKASIYDADFDLLEQDFIEIKTTFF